MADNYIRPGLCPIPIRVYSLIIESKIFLEGRNPMVACRYRAPQTPDRVTIVVALNFSQHHLLTYGESWGYTSECQPRPSITLVNRAGFTGSTTQVYCPSRGHNVDVGLQQIGLHEKHYKLK